MTIWVGSGGGQVITIGRQGVCVWGGVEVMTMGG